MPNQTPYGNLTATLVVVAFLELVIDRLLSRLFLSPGCHTGIGCLLLRGGPFLLHLTGALTLVVATGGIVGHLKRGELFPRGMRLTIAVLSLTFLLLLALSLVFGRIPDRYYMHLETSFGFVVALLVLSLVGTAGAPLRPRIGLLLFGLPPLLHIAALVAARGGWLNHSVVTPERLTSIGEVVLLFAALTAPLLLLPSGTPRSRIGAGVAFAAGTSVFFCVAFVGRTDLVQTLALYSVQLELPRALSLLGVLYVAALFGFTTAAAVLLLSGGAARLTGLGVCLMGLGGYQTASPVSFGLTLCGLLALATGTMRAASRQSLTSDAPMSPAGWRSFLDAVATALAAPPHGAGTPVVMTSDGLQVAVPSDHPAPAGGDGAADPAGESNTGTLVFNRRNREVEMKLARVHSTIRRIEVTVGQPGAGPPDATIESHEAWLARRPEDRVPLARTKTGDAAFDRRLGIHGRAPVGESDLRRRILGLAAGTIALWSGRATRFVAPGNRAEDSGKLSLPAGAVAIRSLVEITDTLIRLVEAGEETAPPDAAE